MNALQETTITQSQYSYYDYYIDSPEGLYEFTILEDSILIEKIYDDMEHCFVGLISHDNYNIEYWDKQSRKLPQVVKKAICDFLGNLYRNYCYQSLGDIQLIF